ncbi:unnamed protein product [Discula destructiva]
MRSAARILFGAALLLGGTRAQTADSVDVLVVGGGASGAHAAVRLRDDFNKTVLVVEKANRLGGHVHAWNPGNGGRNVNYGVQAYLNRDTTRAFFERFGVGLINPDLTDYIDLLLLTKNVDFATGKSVDVDYGPVDIAGIPIGLLRYISIVSDYQSWFENGYFQTGEMPEDLTLPFGDFLRKHHLEASLGILRNLLWLSDTLNTPTFHVLAVVGLPQLQAFGMGLAGPSFKWPETYSSETLFDNILPHLGQDVLLESTISSSNRTDDGVIVTVQTPSGPRTIQAKKMLIAATPSPDNTAPWDLDETEQGIFDKFSWETLYVGVVNGTGLPTDVTGIRNVPNNPDTLYLPEGSFCDALDQHNGVDLYSTRIIGTAALTEDEAKALVTSSLSSMKQAGTYDTATPNIVAIRPHGYTVPKVTGDELKAGFYNQLYSLQGRRSTYWTGLTFAPDYTPILWDFNEKLFPQILEGL